ncbi:outer membrane beta-barrel protein [Massilia sp. W12]|uniref:outer membrane beta-barrel protein n=1 Tax=Massilia sp. W12 TaxID=3126507 RepID=UPI0030CD0A3D
MHCKLPAFFNFLRVIQMKKILIAALITGASAVSMSAHAEGAYAGVALEKSNYSIEVVGANVTSTSDKPTGFKIFGGYEFTPHLALEGGYADFGSAKTTFSSGAATGSAEVKVSSFYLAGRGTAPINDKFSVYGKLGVARNKADVSGSGLGVSVSGGGNKTDLYAAVGAAYHLTKNAAITLELESFGKVDGNGGKANIVSLGARFNF